MSNRYHRSPIVVVLGHVDHGKTTLLDTIRKTNRADKEIGQITQTIGAYEAKIPIAGHPVNTITFIDTPGHEAFTTMRLRGADVADIAVLIVDAVDSIMPQTKESLYHIKSAAIPFVVAINKIDMPAANIEKVKKDLLKEGINLEGMGGDIPWVGISAKEGTGISDLLEIILLIAQQRDLTYDLESEPKIYIIESAISKAGVAVSAIIKDGRLKSGDTVFAGPISAKVRALVDDQGHNLKEVLPSKPFLILGFKELPAVGLITTSKQSDREENELTSNNIDPKELLNAQKRKQLKILIKTDNRGSLEAIVSAIGNNNNINTVLHGVGEINKSDIFLARIANAIIINFMNNVDRKIHELAQQEGIIIKSYSLIYKLLEELQEVSDVLSEQEEKTKRFKGEAKILATFIIEGQKIAGIKVVKGKIGLGDKIEIYRGKSIIGESKINSLKKRANTATEIKKNEEGGVLLLPQLDISASDVIKSYSI